MTANQQLSAVVDDSSAIIPSCISYFAVAGQEGYLTFGVYEDGRLGELFITMAKEGS